MSKFEPMTEKLFKDLDSGNKSSILKKRIINYYIYNGNSTIAELAKTLDISIPTTTKLIDEMSAAGILNTYGKLETNEGRHPLLYGLNPDSAYFVGVDINHGSINIGLINFNGELIDHRMKEPYDFSNDLKGLDNLCHLIVHFIDNSPVERSKILNVNVNISGRVNPESGYSYSWFNLGEVPLTQLISDRIGSLSVSIDNDTRAMTYGEYMCGSVNTRRNVLFINVSWGLGLGIIIDGKTYFGNSGFAGELGHYPTYDNEIICHCGKKGCLETEASGKAVHRKLFERLSRGESSIIPKDILKDKDTINLEAIVSAVLKEDVLCIEIIEEIGQKLGKQIAGLINLFNPEEVVIGGILSLTGDYLIQPIRAAVRKHSLNMVNRDTVISGSRLREKAGMVGACMLARSRVFDSITPTAVPSMSKTR